MRFMGRVTEHTEAAEVKIQLFPRNGRLPGKLERVLCADEFPRKFEFFRELGGEGLYAVDLGGVVTAEVEVEFFLLRAVETVFAQFTGDQRVDAGREEFRHGAVTAAAAEGDVSRLYQISPIPVSYFLDAQGNIRYVYVGTLTTADVVALVQRLRDTP